MLPNGPILEELTDYKWEVLNARLITMYLSIALQAAFHAFANSSEVTQIEKDHIKCLRVGLNLA